MIFSADIEDWQQSVLDVKRPVSNRVLHNTYQLLDILAEPRPHENDRMQVKKGVKGTFFVQGMVADKFPQLIRSIAQQGHELASHAWSHRPLYTLTPAQFDEELKRSVHSLEQQSGQKVIGFRAPTFSIRTEMLDWYCDSLNKYGIRYDSSVMLAQVRKVYGFSDDSIIKQLEQRGIASYPLSTATVLGKTLPVMGGGYFRVYPYWLTQHLARQLDRDTSIFYMHPYELDTTEYAEVAKPAAISKRWALHQFARRSTLRQKLNKLLTDYPFTSFRAHYFHGEYSEYDERPTQKNPQLCAA